MSDRGEELHFKGTQCDSCRRLYPKEALDEDGWCAECRPRMQRRMRISPHMIAALIVVPFAIWVWGLDKADFLPPYAWLIPLGAAYYLGFRIGRETVKGYLRWRHVR